MAAALKNLVSEKSTLPDLVVHRGFHPINEYNNPNLIPGMYPTLFPFGIGGFEDDTRSKALSFQQQAQYYLNIADRSFRYHHSFIFVVWNMIQRRMAHLKTFFTQVAQNLTKISPAILDSLASKVEREHRFSDLAPAERNAMNLLKQIRSYFSYFGLSHLFFTFNPCPAHSPIFQVMYGDQTVDLSHRFPRLASAWEHAMHLAHDPVAAADFYEFSFKCCFKYLLGWNFKTRSSSLLWR
ncbi:uncharacterized protein BJ212DRAFT_1571908 [Suillus subaureus]|uniref:Helitron helicase-like domain-containing protein n=1 Tax=Suillus subaureus TaxID=48587 RepID=A0A9P7ASF1_9AGAM|nr:uncharacterized protein BJ212DRAFT_1571908 [Suillus subaureus]KAG1794514.1 hypothetical protein BJ212DRAFT_1571908 [Suillus subaureus]